MVKFGWWQRQWGYGGSSWLKGEAVVVEVAPGKYLFALLKEASLAWDVFLPVNTPMEQAGAKLEVLRETRELTQDQYPVLATFGDINDPTSVKQVNAADLKATFGPGYSLKSITMTITDEQVTEGAVERLLHWLGKYPGTNKLGPRTKKSSNIPFNRQVSFGDFIRR